MNGSKPPSLDIPEAEKLSYTEADVHSKLFEPDVVALKADPQADIDPLRAEIDEQIFDLFEIRDSRKEVLDFYESVGKATEGDGAPQPAQDTNE